MTSTLPLPRSLPLDVDAIRTAATGRWAEILSRLGIDVPSNTKLHGPCPTCGGKDRFRFDDQGGTGSWFCNQCDPKAGDGFALVQNVRQCTFPEALELVADALGQSPHTGCRSRTIEAAKQQREADERRRHEEARERAQEIWAAASTVTSDHPYFPRKQVQPHGLRLYRGPLVIQDRSVDGAVIIPLKDADGTLWSLEFILPDGTKRFFPGGRKRGCFHMLGEVCDTIAIAEGYATAASLHEATRYPVAVAFDAGNLKPVAEQLRRQYPTAAILLCGDNDLHDDGKPNAGLEAATAAAYAINGLLVMPELDGKKCDWNDVHVQQGVDAVRQAIEDIITQKERAMVTVTAEPTRETDKPAETWPVLDDAALHGLPGAFIKAVEPYSEADPVGILLHCLSSAGVMIGARPHVLVEHLPHYARTNILLVGMTAGGRKGTAWSPVRYVLTHVEESFALKRVKSGLSSGEGLIYQVRDPQYDQEPIREGGRKTGEITGYQEVLSDPGESDKRLLIIESEFASALTVMEREGNTLSSVLRDVWDHGNLSPLTKKDRMAATGAHVAIIGHITSYELLRKMTATERTNGGANRFLIAKVRQSKFLPSGKGAPAEVIEPFFLRFMRTIERAKTRGTLLRDGDCEALWASVYRRLAEVPPGLTGSILARGAAQVLRLSLMYALLDEGEAQRADTAIRVPHLLAALAVWDYCTASAYQIFGDAIGDPVADRFLRLIKSGPQSDTNLYESMGKHEGDRNRKDLALELLQRLDRIHPMSLKTPGRTLTEWHIGISSGCALCAKRGERSA